MSRQKQMDNGDKRLFLLHILLFFLVFLVELVLLILNKISVLYIGKVTSSLTSQLDVVLPLLLPYIFGLFFVVVVVYLFFAWCNYRITCLISRIFVGSAVTKGKCCRLTIHDVVIFFLVNFLFFVFVIFFNTYLYPASIFALNDLVNLTPSGVEGLFLFFLFFYFFLVLISLFYERRYLCIFFVSLIIIIVAPFDRGVGLSFGSNNLEKINKGPNIIIIGIDSLRYDFLDREKLPHLADFFDDAIVFDEAFTPLARTYPSWMSLLTGRYPVHSGIRYNLMKREFLAKDILTLPSYLKKFGYTTFYAIDECRFCNILHDDGFDDLLHPHIGVCDFILGRFHDFTLLNLFLNNGFGRYLLPILNINRGVAHLYRGEFFVQDLISSLKKLNQTDRFFMAVHFCMPHWPFVSAGVGKGKLGVNWLRPRERYVYMLQKVDRQFSQLMTAINDYGLLDRSIIIVLSDHGESFENYWGHGTDLRDLAQNRIVMAFKLPNSFLSKPIPKMRGPVSIVDLYPTILSLIDLPYPTDYSLDGVNIFSHDASHGPIFLETGFHLFHKNGQGFTLYEMLKQGLEYYEVNPENGYITVKKDFHNDIIMSKQFGVVIDDLMLVYHSESSERKIFLINWRKNELLNQSEKSVMFSKLKDALDSYLEGNLQ